MSFTVGHRTIPAFRSIGIMGFHVAFVAALLTAIRTDFPLVVTAGLSATAALSFFAWGLLRRAVTGTEQLVLLEHVWVAFALVAAYLWYAGASMLSGLDVLAVGLAPFLAFGRIGCFVVGCCHGTPVQTGIRYGADHDHLPPWLIGRRLRPVPLLETGGLLVIFAISLLLVGGPPGALTVWFLAAYSVLRFGTEALRGDVRPHVGPVSVARLMSIVQLGAAVWIWDSVVTDRGVFAFRSIGDTTELTGSSTTTWSAFITRLAPIFATLMAGALLTVVRHRRPNPLVERPHLRECWFLMAELAASLGSTANGNPTSSIDVAPMLATTSKGLDVAVSAIDAERLHVSFHHADHDAGPLAVLLAAEPVLERNGIHHTSFTRAAMPGAPTSPISNGQHPFYGCETHPESVESATGLSAPQQHDRSTGDRYGHQLTEPTAQPAHRADKAYFTRGAMSPESNEPVGG
jgi:hypothetical protein